MNLAAQYAMDAARSARDGWNRFWFTPSDPATLAMIRIFAGSMIFYTHLVWSIDLLGFFGPQARLSEEFVQVYHNTPFAWSYLQWIDSPALLWTAHIAALIAIAMFTLGLFTRITSVLTFIITVAYVHRAAGALFGLDQINGMLALYLAVGPAGAAYSLDRWIRKKRSPVTLPAVEKSVGANISIRLMQLHMCVIYLFAGAGKMLGETWWDGTAMWGAFANYEYQTLDMTWLAAHPLAINALTHITIFWELSYAALVWPRWTRPIIIFLAIPLHMGIVLSMGMITFGLVMLIGNMAFISPRITRSVIDKVCWPRRGAGG